MEIYQMKLLGAFAINELYHNPIKYLRKQESLRLIYVFAIKPREDVLLFKIIICQPNSQR